MPKSPEIPTIYSPITWISNLGIFFLRVLACLPWRCLMPIGALIGWCCFQFASKSRHLANVNLALCFPDLSSAERTKLCRDSFISVGQGFVETVLAWWGSTRQLEQIPFDIVGLEHLQAAQAQGKGVLLLGAHFSALQLTGRLFAQHISLSVVFRHQRLRVLNVAMHRVLNKHFQTAIVREDLRGLMRALKRGETVWYTPDIDPRHKANIFVKFFGVDASTVVIPARFSEKLGVPIVFSDYRRTDTGYEISFHPSPDVFPTGDEHRDTQLINDKLEAMIREKPSQYLWQYKRFKTQPEGKPNPYKEHA